MRIIQELKPPDPHGTGHPGLGHMSSIGESPIATSYPANYRQKVAHGGETAQITGRADKVWAVVLVDAIYKWPD
jgi:hypothetical protein